MIQYKLKDNNYKAEVHLATLIDLLEYKVMYLKQEKEKDSSWNYPIEETQKQIDELKAIYSNRL